MTSLNQVFLIGNVGKEPELKTTPGGSAVCNFSVATSESYKDKNGEWQTKTEWHKVQVWNKQAEFVGANVRKGAQVCIEGKIQTRMWEKDGVKNYITEINAQRVHLLGAIEKRQAAATYEINQESNYTVDTIPF